MQCFGLTKNKKRCRNHTNFIFCKKHSWQPISAIIFISGLLGTFAGLFQDLLKPIMDAHERENELKELVSVEVEKNRRLIPEWENNTDPTLSKSDVVTILSARQPIKSLEIYHMAKDKKFKDYPATAPLAESFIPTEVHYQVLDLDNDGSDEIILVFNNQLYSLHYDKQINILIFNGKGEMISKTPYPNIIPGLNLKVHNPYSAYKTTAVMLDAISEKSYSTTFSNDFNIINKNNKKILQFSWVIDNAPYTSTHMHQVEEFTYERGKLIPTQNYPQLYINDGWENAMTGKIINSLTEANDFLKKNNLPSFIDTYRDLKSKTNVKAENNKKSTLLLPEDNGDS